MVKRLTVFLLALGLVVVFYWTVGNFVPFLDETQLMLLSLLKALTLGLSSTSVVGLGASLLLGRTRPRSSRLAAAGGYLFLALLGLLGLVLASGLSLLSLGLGPSP